MTLEIEQETMQDDEMNYGLPTEGRIIVSECNLNNIEQKKLSDFPKVHCPYIRKQVSKKQYLVTPEINEGYEWVFDDPDTIAVEKLHGTNVKIYIEDKKLITIQNRKTPIDRIALNNGQNHIIEGVYNYLSTIQVRNLDGEYAGELIGPKVNGNPYNLVHHTWYGFNDAIERLRYRQYEKMEHDFESIESWMRDSLKSKLHAKIDCWEAYAEGVIFYNLKRKAEGKTYMAKLRRDMYSWFYDYE